MNTTDDKKEENSDEEQDAQPAIFTKFREKEPYTKEQIAEFDKMLGMIHGKKATADK